MNTIVVTKDFEIHTTPLEKVIMDAYEIQIFLDDINEKRYKIRICPYQAYRIVTIDCFSIATYYNEYCTRDGVYHTHILEVVESEWIKELKNSLTDTHAIFLNEAKHYVLPLQENVIEFVAKGFDMVEISEKMGSEIACHKDEREFQE